LFFEIETFLPKKDRKFFFLKKQWKWSSEKNWKFFTKEKSWIFLLNSNFFLKKYHRRFFHKNFGFYFENIWNFIFEKKKSELLKNKPVLLENRFENKYLKLNQFKI
jgi:hypothetical protein